MRQYTGNTQRVKGCCCYSCHLLEGEGEQHLHYIPLWIQVTPVTETVNHYKREAFYHHHPV